MRQRREMRDLNRHITRRRRLDRWRRTVQALKVLRFPEFGDMA